LSKTFSRAALGELGEMNDKGVTITSLPLNPFLFPSIREYTECNFQAAHHPLHNS